VKMKVVVNNNSATVADNVPRFDNSFWDEEIGQFQGWEVVVRRLKDGRQVLKEYAEFLKQRAAIEEQLGKSLVKLAKSVSIREDQDPQSNVWEMMKSQTETSGLAHLKSAHQLSAELTKISEISEQSRDKRRLKESLSGIISKTSKCYGNVHANLSEFTR